MSTSYKYDQAGLQCTKRFEGCKLKAYQDVVGVWTIGYGHTGPEVHAGLVWTQEQADAALLADLQSAVAFVNAHAASKTQGEFDSLVDFAFNVGQHSLLTSTLLRDLNAGNVAAVPAQFLLWDHAGGKVFAGLLERRQAESAMFQEAA